MIKLSNVTLLDKKNNREPINFSNEKNITYLDYKDKAIFNLLSIRQQYIKDGEMSIDDFSLFPLKDQKKYAFVLNINSQVISLNAVFVLELSFKDKTRGLLKKDLQALRNFPLESEEDKISKITKIFEVLEKFDAKYLLINTNEEVNETHMSLITKVMNEHEKLTYFILNKKPQVAPQVVSETKKVKKEKPIEVKSDSDKTKEGVSLGEQVLQDQYRNKEEEEEFMTVTRTMPIVTDEVLAKEFEDFEKEFENFNIDIAYKKASDKKEQDVSLGRKKASKINSRKPLKSFVFVKEIFKHLYLYYLFIGLFSIFLSICSFSSVYLINHNNGLIAGILIFLGIVFIFMHVYIIGSTYAGIRKRLTENIQKVAFVGFFILFTAIGLGIGLGFIFILSANDVFVKTSEYVLSDWLLGIIVSSLALIAPCGCSLLATIYIKLHYLFEKLFPHNSDEEE